MTKRMSFCIGNEDDVRLAMSTSKKTERRGDIERGKAKAKARTKYKANSLST